MFTEKDIRRSSLIRNIILWSFIALVIGCALYFARALASVVADLKKHNSEADSAIAYHNAALKLIDEIQRTTGNGPKIYEAFPPANDLVFVSDIIKGTAERHNLKGTVTFSDPQPTAQILPPDQNQTVYTLHKVVLTLKYSGDAASIERFIKEFESLPYFISIAGLSITSNEKNGWEDGAELSGEAILFAKY